MKPFKKLTYLGQVRRLRKLAKAALTAYGLGDANFSLIMHGENTTFRVNTPSKASDGGPKGDVCDKENDNTLPGAYLPGRFLLRVHRPGYQNTQSIHAELQWLSALRKSGLIVPDPLLTTDGNLFTESSAPGVPTPRVCSVLRWMRGRFYETNPRPRHFQALGRLMAQLHAHAADWIPPTSFERRHWDWEGLFGDHAGFDHPKEEVWAMIPDAYRETFKAVADETRHAMNILDEDRESVGLLHADLHFGNVLFARSARDGNLEARPIDFDDCGFAHWVYDFAVVLAEALTDDWHRSQDALYRGYAEIRPLPEDQLVHLGTFMAARHVSLALWGTDLAQSNPRFAQDLEGWYTWAIQCIQQAKSI